MSIRRRSSFFAVGGIVAALLSFASATTARADEDPLAPYRDRFRLGMDRYRAGAMAEAIRVWNGIYEEIGPKRGYRLAFDLARAYDTNGEATRAAERYRSFLDEVAARRAASETIEPIVDREARDAEARLEALNRDHGRIDVPARRDATLAQVDDTDPRLGAFIAYVAPGKHVVTFGPGKPDAVKVEVVVEAGQLVPVKGPEAAARPPPETPSLLEPRTRQETRHPFSPVVLYAGAVATAASVVAPVLAYGYANSLAATYRSSTASAATKTNAFNDYSGARALAYTTLAVPIAFAAATGVLTTWYFAGTREVTVTVGASVSPTGATGTLFTTF